MTAHEEAVAVLAEIFQAIGNTAVPDTSGGPVLTLNQLRYVLPRCQIPDDLRSRANAAVIALGG